MATYSSSALLPLGAADNRVSRRDHAEESDDRRPPDTSVTVRLEVGEQRSSRRPDVGEEGDLDLRKELGQGVDGDLFLRGESCRGFEESFVDLVEVGAIRVRVDVLEVGVVFVLEIAILDLIVLLSGDGGGEIDAVRVC